MSPHSHFWKNLYKILRILAKFNCFENLRSNNKRFTQQRRLKINNGKGIFKKIKIFGKCLSESRSLGFHPESIPRRNIKYLSFSKLIFILCTIFWAFYDVDNSGKQSKFINVANKNAPHYANEFFASCFRL